MTTHITQIPTQTPTTIGIIAVLDESSAGCNDNIRKLTKISGWVSIQILSTNYLSFFFLNLDK